MPNVWVRDAYSSKYVLYRKKGKKSSKDVLTCNEMKWRANI